jgi:hypothetical protein
MRSLTFSVESDDASVYAGRAESLGAYPKPGDPPKGSADMCLSKQPILGQEIRPGCQYTRLYVEGKCLFESLGLGMECRESLQRVLMNMTSPRTLSPRPPRERNSRLKEWEFRGGDWVTPLHRPFLRRPYPMRFRANGSPFVDLIATVCARIMNRLAWQSVPGPERPSRTASPGGFRLPGARPQTGAQALSLATR